MPTRRLKVNIIRYQGDIIKILNDQLLNTRRLLNVSSLENLSLKQKVCELTTRLETVTKMKDEDAISKLFSPPNDPKKTLKRRPDPGSSLEMFPEDVNVATIPVVKKIKLMREKKMSEEDYEKEIEDLKTKLESQENLISSHSLSKEKKEEQVQGLRVELARVYALNEKYFNQNSIQQTVAKIAKISDKLQRKTRKKKVILEELQAKKKENNRFKEELAEKDLEIKNLQNSESLSQKELCEAKTKVLDLEATVSSLTSKKDKINNKLETQLKVKNVNLKKDNKKKTNMLRNLARKFVKLKRDEKYNVESLVASIKIIENLENELKARNVILEKIKSTAEKIDFET